MNKIKMILCTAMCVLGVEMNAFAESKNALLECSWQNISAEKVKEMIEQGADVNAKDEYGRTMLMYACIKYNRDIAELLISNGADVNAKKGYGYTALKYAHEWSHEDLEELLISNGADVSVINHEGSSNGAGDEFGFGNPFVLIIGVPVVLAIEAYDTVTGWFKK